MIIQTFLIVLALCITFFLLKRQRKNTLSTEDETYQIKFDQYKLALIFPDGTKQYLAIADLSAVTIKTTDKGPIEPDLFWQFHTHFSESATMIIPQGTIGEDDLMSFLGSRLSGFDYEQVISATGSTDNALFVVWAKNQQG